MDTHVLYGAPLSLYTGKARSYLIKNRIPYREITPTTEHYENVVLPLAKMRMVPTLETADGLVIRDSTAIVDHFEDPAGNPASPGTPRQRVLSALFDVIGLEGLLRPAMHYRWNFDAQNEAFLLHHFETMVPGDRGKELAAKGMGRMRMAAVSFGVTDESFGLIEDLYRRVIAAFDVHFAESPYLFGNRPSIGDFGLISPMYGHLGRDPKPLALLQAEAIHFFRWVERMNRPELDNGEYVPPGAAAPDDSFAADDAIPETLVSVLRTLAIDFVPETLAAADVINDWIGAQPELEAGTPLTGRPLQRGVGLANFEVEGKPMHGLAQPHRFYLLARVQADFDAMPPDEQAQVEDLLTRCNMLPVLSARLSRQIGRSENLEVWL